jgi:hypothetical protein
MLHGVPAHRPQNSGRLNRAPGNGRRAPSIIKPLRKARRSIAKR